MSKNQIFLQRIKLSPGAFRANLKENKGQITLFALLLSMMLIAYTLFVILKCQNTHLEIKARLEAYQCLHYLDYETKDYIKKIGSLNQLIWTSHKIVLLSGSNPKAQALHHSLIRIQDLAHFSYMKKIIKNHYCHLEQNLAYVTNTPYKKRAKFFLQHEANGTVKLENKKWTIKLLALKKNFPLFILKAGYQVKDQYALESKLSVVEEKVF